MDPEQLLDDADRGLRSLQQSTLKIITTTESKAGLYWISLSHCCYPRATAYLPLAMMFPDGNESTAAEVSTTATRDKKYYFPDGNCIMLVENTLFNVHRSILSRDSSMFSELFTLPQGENLEGSSDLNPVIIHGDTADEFHNFLWAMYALPHELKELSSKQSEIPKLLDIIKLAKKYGMESVEDWAYLAALTNTSSCVNRLQNWKARCRFGFFTDTDIEHPADKITMVIRFSALTRNEKLLRGTINALKEQFASSTECLVFALQLCHTLEADATIDSTSPLMRMLFGETYYAAMLHGPSFWNASNTNLSPQAKSRILIGHYRLSHEWAETQTETMQASHSAFCSGKSHKQCKSRWKEFWKHNIISNSSILEIDLADVRGKLEAALSAIDGWFNGSTMDEECKQETRQVFQSKLEQFTEKLADYFLKA